jgi:hypothetical protein
LSLGQNQGEDLQIINQRMRDIIDILKDFNGKKEDGRFAFFHRIFVVVV